VSASNASAPLPEAVPGLAGDGGGLVAVFLVNATRTSSGSGPGVLLVPPAEAARLTAARLAVYGTEPPRGWPG
jgi:hypothetical protein